MSRQFIPAQLDRDKVNLLNMDIATLSTRHEHIVSWLCEPGADEPDMWERDQINMALNEANAILSVLVIYN